LNLWGESIDDSIQPLHALPQADDDDHETTIGSVTTTSIETGSVPTDVPATPSDHIHRPINSKPGSSPTETSSTSASTSEPTSTLRPTTKPDSFFPSFLPTFGVSQRTQIWIYGAFGLIVLFCVALGAYFLIQQRRRRRNIPRDDYEFEMLDDDNGSNDEYSGGRGATGAGRPKRRAGELYDAFAGESDEELLSSDDEEESAEEYRDSVADEGHGRGSGRADGLGAGDEKSS
jgi:kexin